MSSTDKIKVLVLGDCGVGKSSLVHLMCHSNAIASVKWTIGASVDVKLHEFNEGTPNQRTYLIELWDIGGYKTHSLARNVFYNSFHGIILVYDLTNIKSHENLRKWLCEVFTAKDSSKDNCRDRDISQLSTNSDNYFDIELFVEMNIPVVVVGTKLDLLQTSVRTRLSSIAEECGAEEILLDCHLPKSLAPASTNSVKLSRFFDKVIERKFGEKSVSRNPILRTVDLTNSFEQNFQSNKKHNISFVPSNKYSHLD
ncbi:rab-like protein 3 [Leptotrombidium deliense]|uniref:Rab-like protein 3 n=1 Tax=Leptotrombidium deliense TaxID=299467 RepID=A0A443SEI2_9ACAR|nr:rab-like protein 3 [Leptotrombidium deliense]